VKWTEAPHVSDVLPDGLGIAAKRLYSALIKEQAV